jgi:ElaA protein
MKISLDYVKENLKPDLIIMSAQVYLINFYSGFGFKTTGNEYLEDDIPHIKMELES